MTEDGDQTAASPKGYEVISNTTLSADVHRLVIRAPRVAAVRQPGQFVIVRLGPGAERIPLTIAESDAEQGRGESRALLPGQRVRRRQLADHRLQYGQQQYPRL